MPCGIVGKQEEPFNKERGVFVLCLGDRVTEEGEVLKNKEGPWNLSSSTERVEWEGRVDSEYKVHENERVPWSGTRVKMGECVPWISLW